MNSKSMPDVEASNMAMALAFEHYSLHRQIVLRRLRHAQMATRQSLNEIKKWQKEHGKTEKHEQALREIEKYDDLWETVIDLFESTYVSDLALKEIEKTLSGIPALIKKYYDALISQDEALREMVTKLAERKYQEAHKLIKDIQGQPCPFSGLEPAAFELDEKHAEAFRFRPPVNSKKRRS